MADSTRKNSQTSKECPVCLEIFKIPIRQCVKGHSFCSICIRALNSCPMCRGPISEARNFVLEELIENEPLPCENELAGCVYKLNKLEMTSHKAECQYRKFKCEGVKFCNWICNWEGKELQEHFKDKHSAHISLQFNSTVTTDYNHTSNFTDLQLIAAHYQLFWYKHKIDITKQKAYWIFQFIGPKTKASKFYYEFEIFTEPPSVRKYKLTESCVNDIEDIDKIFESEKCVAISLKALKHFVNEKNEYSFRFRIMKLKSEEQSFKKPPGVLKPYLKKNK